MFEPATQAAAQDARSLIALARVAKARGLDDIAHRAFAEALALLGSESTLAERSIIADYAAAQRDYSAVIGVLDGYIQEDRQSPELQRLAEAHALERPQRSRNLEFFERLPSAVRDRNDFARPWASVLLGFGKHAEAERILRSMVKSNSADVYALLALAEALRCEGRTDEVSPLLLAADENMMRGPIEYRMNLAHELRNASAPARALKYAYGLVREEPDNPKIALGYVFLILGDRTNNIVPDAPTVAKDTWVRVGNAVHETLNFTIDDDASFFGSTCAAQPLLRSHELWVSRKTTSLMSTRGLLPRKLGESWKSKASTSTCFMSSWSSSTSSRITMGCGA